MEELPRIRVDADLGRVADFHVRELRLAIICLNPLDLADKGNRLCSGGHKLSGSNLPFTHGPVIGRFNLGVAEVHLRDGQRSLLATQVGDQLDFLRIQNVEPAAFGIDCRLTTGEHCLGLLQ